MEAKDNAISLDSILNISLKSTSFSNDAGDLTWTLEFKLECVEGEMTMVAWEGEAWESNWRGNSKDYSSRSTFEKVTYELIVQEN